MLEIVVLAIVAVVALVVLFALRTPPCFRHWRPTMADRSSWVFRTSVENEPNHGGVMQEKAINHGQSLNFVLVPATTDDKGLQFNNADGTPLTADQLSASWVSSDTQIAPLTGVAADGKSGKFISGDPAEPAHLGRAELTCSIGPYPDGSTKSFSFGLTVGFSAPGDPSFDTTTEDET